MFQLPIFSYNFTCRGSLWHWLNSICDRSGKWDSSIKRDFFFFGILPLPQYDRVLFTSLWLREFWFLKIYCIQYCFWDRSCGWEFDKVWKTYIIECINCWFLRSLIKSALRNSTVLSVAFCDILGWSVAKKDKKKWIFTLTNITIS